jgi:hypothetical protein
MTLNKNSIMEGGCTCRQLRYRLGGTPLIVHACHCRWCQRETGTATHEKTLEVVELADLKRYALDLA